jgi:5'-nucleotidase
MSQQLKVAISSRALFDLSESHAVFEAEGLESFRRYQQAHEYDVLEKGPAFTLVQKLLGLNEHANPDDPIVEVLLLSRNAADTGLRVFHSIAQHGLGIKRAAFAGGENPYHYAKAFGADLFLSLHPEDVQTALAAGIAAAHIWSNQHRESPSSQIRIAFDGDCVLFSDQAELIYQQQGVDAFNQAEREARLNPLPQGPFKPLLQTLHQIQQRCPGAIRTALVTARSAPAHERVIRTLRAWNIEINEALFLGGLDKSAFLSAFSADIFFDDNRTHCQSARDTVTTGHVPVQLD